jgi:hypothetical protein
MIKVFTNKEVVLLLNSLEFDIKCSDNRLLLTKVKKNLLKKLNK